MSRSKTCRCGRECDRGGWTECNECIEQRERVEADHHDGRVEVILLRQCTDLAELKLWIEEYLLK